MRLTPDCGKTINRAASTLHATCSPALDPETRYGDGLNLHLTGAAASARTWTTVAGENFEADYASSTPSSCSRIEQT